MAASLKDAFFQALGIRDSLHLQQRIMRSSQALMVTDSVVYPMDSAVESTVVDLFSAQTEKFDAAVVQLAALWISAKFWGASLQRVSIESLVTDIFLHMDRTGDARTEEKVGMNYDVPHRTQHIVDRIFKAEMLLLRRCGFVVPEVYICKADHSV